MFRVSELQVVNESTTFPEFITNYMVTRVGSRVPVLTTTSEDKAHSVAFSLNGRANSREMQYNKGAFAPFFMNNQE